VGIDGDAYRPPVDSLTDLLTVRARAVSVAQAALLEAVVTVADRDPDGFDTDLVAFSLAWTQPQPGTLTWTSPHGDQYTGKPD
jgi:hypothetical protein